MTTAVVLLPRACAGFERELMRGGIEIQKGKPNIVDPMSMTASWHDVYPKPDLRSGYIGDGFPHCRDLTEQGQLFATHAISTVLKAGETVYLL